MKHNEITEAILAERFGEDTLIALATVSEGRPAVRAVNTLYLDGAFYVVTYALSGKVQQLSQAQRADDHRVIGFLPNIAVPKLPGRFLSDQ